jgi:SAM-dependent methyltransferase
MEGSALLQGHLWSGAAHTWAELQEPIAAPLWDAMLVTAGVGSGTRLLDAGCGAGGASVLAAQRGALVNGLDAAEAMVAIARQRVPDGDFQVGDVELLPYAGHTFDAVIAADVLPYTAQPAVALRELVRVCRPDGHLVVAVRATPADQAGQALAGALQALLPVGYAGLEPNLGAEPEALDALLAGAGLRVLAAGEVSCPWDYADRETAWQAQASTGPVQAALRLLGESPVRGAVLRALAPWATADGAVRLVYRYRYIMATPQLTRKHA